MCRLSYPYIFQNYTTRPNVFQKQLQCVGHSKEMHWTGKGYRPYLKNHFLITHVFLDRDVLWVSTMPVSLISSHLCESILRSNLAHFLCVCVQELSKITMPIVFNEPLSFLQRITEYMEHTYLINKACSLSDSIERMQVRD